MAICRLRFRALEAQALILLLFARIIVAEPTTTTTTLTSTTTFWTSTVTIISEGRTYVNPTAATTTTEDLNPTNTPAPVATMSWGSGSGNYSRSALRLQALNSTNYYRELYEATPLGWDLGLAQYAQRYVERCIWEHSGGPYGENMALGFGSPSQAIGAWAAEEIHYNYGKAQFTETTGHFSQLVWKNTDSVSCGAVECDNDANGGAHGWFMVCEYTPRGNVIGNFRHNVGKPGEDANGRPGFGAASRIGGSSRLLVALVVMSSLIAICS